MFEYENNDQLKNELKKVVIDCNTTNKEVAEKMGITPQTYQHLINKKQFSFSDMKRIANAAGFRLIIDLVPGENVPDNNEKQIQLDVVLKTMCDGFGVMLCGVESYVWLYGYYYVWCYIICDIVLQFVWCRYQSDIKMISLFRTPEKTYKILYILNHNSHIFMSGTQSN